MSAAMPPCGPARVIQIYCVTAEEQKAEIIKALNNLSEDALLLVLKELENRPGDQRWVNDLRDILNEEKDLLKRLAK